MRSAVSQLVMGNRRGNYLENVRDVSVMSCRQADRTGRKYQNNYKRCNQMSLKDCLKD